MDGGRASLVAICLLALTGCSSTGTSRFSTTSLSPMDAKGSKSARVMAGGKSLNEHVRSAMEDVGINQINQVNRLEGTSFEGRTAAGRKATVTVAPQGTQSLVSTKFGLLGDDSLTLAFFDRLELLEKNSGKPTKDVKVAQAGDEKSDEEDEQPKRKRRLSRDGVSDSEMLKGQADVGYKDSPIP